MEDTFIEMISCKINIITDKDGKIMYEIILKDDKKHNIIKQII